MQFGYIATTAQSEIWNCSDPILLLGSWCRPGLEKVKPKECAELPSIWETDHSIAEAELYCWEVFGRLIRQLGVSLNRFHDVNRSQRYWEVLLSLWFIHFINVLYDRYLLVRSAKNAAKDAWTTVVPRKNYAIPTTSFDSVKAYAYDDKHNLQLFSEVFRFFGLNVLENSNLAKRGNGQCEKKQRQRDRTIWQYIRGFQAAANWKVFKATNQLFQIGRRLGLRNDENLLLYTNHHFKSLDLLVLSVFSGVTVWFPDSDMNLRLECDLSLEARIQLSNDLGGDTSADEFGALALNSAPFFIPTCFVEGYSQLVSKSIERFGKKPRTLVFNSPALNLDPLFEEYAARCAESGKELVSIQHGGAYGHTLSSPAERLEVELCDRFISFGWRDDRFPEKIKTLPTPHLSSLSRVGQPGDFILYISFFGKRYLHRLVSVPHASQWDNYLDYCESFLKSLPSHKLIKVHFRPFFSYGGHSIPPLMESLIQGRQRENRAASQALSDCRIAVIDHASTSWLESLACNTPTILFWNPAHWRFRTNAQPFVEELRKVGILHYDPISAALKLEEIYDYVDEWWNEDDIQRARIDFCERYASTTTHWRRHWITALRSLNGTRGGT